MGWRHVSCRRQHAALLAPAQPACAPIPRPPFAGLPAHQGRCRPGAAAATAAAAHTCHKVRQFLRGCRQVLKFLLERPETHKPRSVADASLIEAQLKKMIPVLSCLVASQHVDTLEGLNPTI